MAGLFFRRRAVRLRDVSPVVSGGAVNLAAGWLGAGLVTLALALSGRASAQAEVYPQWQFGTAGEWFYSIVPVCELVRAGVQSSNPTHNITYTGSPGGTGEHAGHPMGCTVEWRRVSDNVLELTQTLGTGHQHVTEPPPPEDCASYEGPDGFWLIGGEAETPEGTCHVPSGCEATRLSRSCISGSCVASYSFSNREQCGSGGGDDPDVTEGEGEACVESEGNEWCATNVNGENCGYLNDSYICLDSTDSDGCQGLPDDSRVCAGVAPVPPRPDNGTPGVPAPPDLIINTDDDTFNFFDSSTVGGSSRPPNPSGDNPNDGHDDGDGSGGGVEGGEGDGDGDGLHCDPSEGDSCDGDGDGEGHEGDITGGWQCWAEREEGDTTATMADKLQNCFEAAWLTLANDVEENSPLLQTIALTVDAFPSGGTTCPSAGVSVWDIEFDWMEVPCELIEDFRPALSAVWLVFWSFLGLRILLSIPGGD